MFNNMFIKTSNVRNSSTIQADMLYVQYACTKRTQKTIHIMEQNHRLVFVILYQYIVNKCLFTVIVIAVL